MTTLALGIFEKNFITALTLRCLHTKLMLMSFHPRLKQQDNFQLTAVEHKIIRNKFLFNIGSNGIQHFLKPLHNCVFFQITEFTRIEKRSITAGT